MKKYLGLKIFLALLPALIFTQNWAWMTGNKLIGLAFLVLWASMIWFVLEYEDKHQILEKLFRATEIGFFLLPLSAIVLTFVIGSMAVGSTSDEFAQAGAAIGTAIGGVFIVGLSFVIGLFGGIIMHLIANKQEKKAKPEASSSKEESWFNQHKALTIISAMIILAIIASAVSSTKEAQTAVEEQSNNGGSEQVVQEPSPVEITTTSVIKNVIDSPVANVTVKNISDKTIDGLKVDLEVFNNFDEPVEGFLSDNHFDGISQEVIAPGASRQLSWDLYNYDGATKVKATTYHVHFTDGSTWGGAN